MLRSILSITWGDVDSGGNSSAAAERLSEGVTEICGICVAFVAVEADGSVVTWGEASYGGDSSAVTARSSEDIVRIICFL